MKLYRLQTVVQASFGILLLFLPFPHQERLPPAGSAPAPDPSATFARVTDSHTAGWWPTVQRDLRRREYHVTWQESPLVPGGPAPSAEFTVSEAELPRAGGYQAPNRAHNLRIGFYPTGVHIVQRTATHPPWTLGLALTGLGREGELTSADTPTLSVHENHVTYRRSSLTESYTNDENGLEQEFQIPNPQPQIILELTLTGDLIPHLTNDPSTSSGQNNQAIQFTTTGGAPILRYGPPRATDATGRPLPTHLELEPHATRSTSHVLRFTVDTSTALHPITIRTRITTLPTFADWIGESDQDDARLGYALSTAGDVNGDGYSDLVVGAPWYDSGQAGEGAAFVYYGGPTGLVTATTWITHPTGQENAHFGASVSIAGDVNGDSYADVIVGAPDYDDGSPGAGAAFVYHGSPAGLSTGSADWTATGDQENAHFGTSVSTAGDLNGDGYSAVIVGAPDHDGAGAAFVYHGSQTGLTPGTADWIAIGDQSAAHFGAVVSAAGDVDGDGYADVIVGAPDYDIITGTTTLTDTGQIYVYHASSTGLTITGSADWTAWGDQMDAHFGAAISTAGDVNGDGYADVIVGAPQYDTTTLTDTGQAHVYYGGSTGLTIGLADWTATGDQENAQLGAAVSIAGDVNSDGHADVIVGVTGYDGAQAQAQANEGAAYVYLGGSTGLAPAPTWSAHPTDQENANFGAAVSTAGDVNGDGHSDLVIGAPGYDHEQTDEGGAFVYHGGPEGLAATPTWSAAGEQSGVLAGWAVATAGDVNGDGYADVIVGAPRYDHGQAEEGVVFLYTGGPDGPSTHPSWMGESDQEWAWFGAAVATAGDVDNDGYADVIVGAPRYDGEQIDDGKAFVYHGSPTGLTTGPANWVAPPDGQGTAIFGVSARFGADVATAGDVDGDGFADVIITANGYDAEATNEGAAFVYHGGPAGLGVDPAWSAHPTDQAHANFGRSASTAGDVNRDGYSDVIVGAPWYDIDPGSDNRDEGAAFVYHGSQTGLNPDPDWAITGDCKEAEFGLAVSTAGDVNGDGYSDVIVGAYKYTEEFWVTPWREGAAFAYYGGPGGLADNPAWSAKGGQEQAKFGLAVSTAGDVNGDGYADVVVGASSYDGGQSNEGAAFVYHGSSTGLATGPADWIAEGNQEGAAFGFTVSTAGDVNGDGYSDLIVGAPTYNLNHTDEGAAFVYLGNGGGGMPVRPRQLRSVPPLGPPHRGEGGVPIAPLSRSNSANRVRLQLTGRSPLGRETVAFQWQLAPLGVPFTAATAISGTGPALRQAQDIAWSDVLTTGVVLSQTVDDLTGGHVYRWRVRLLYRPGNRIGQASSRWLYLPWNGPQEADFRTPRLLAPDRSATVLAGHPAVYTHTLANPISETQTFTLTGVSSQGYTVTIATSLGGPTATLPAFSWSPVTVTVQTRSTAISSTQDTTVVTATSGLSGHDTVHDVTTIGLVRAAGLSDVFLPLILRGKVEVKVEVEVEVKAEETD